MTRPLATIRSARQRKANAFTLIELMVVIGIIVLMATMLLFGTRAMTAGNSAAQASNVLSAYLANARALAMQRGGYAGVALFEDPDNPNQTAMRLIVSTGPAGVANEMVSFRAAEGYDIQYLPRDVEAATLDSGSVFRMKAAGNTNTSYYQSRVILFDGDGRLVVRDGLTTPGYPGVGAAGPYQVGDAVRWADAGTGDISCYVYTDPTTTTSASEPYNNPAQWHKERWGLYAVTTGAATDATTIQFGRSSPALVLYDANAFADARNAGFPSAGSADAWLRDNGQVVAVNTYTGSLIR